VVVHDPIDLKNHFEDFLRNKHDTSAKIAEQVEACLLLGVKS